MAKIAIDGVRSVNLGVPDLQANVRFYTDVWGLTPVTERGGAVYLRASGPYHHVLSLRQRPSAALLSLDLTAPDRAVVGGLHEAVRKAGITDVMEPAVIGEPGGGYGFAFRDPEGRTLRILTGDARHADTTPHGDRPAKVTHVVLNSRDRVGITDFYCRVLGCRVVDRTKAMTFVCCNADHHSFAFLQADAATLNHIAFEMRDIDAVMRGAGRMRDAGFAIEWGVGRHGPGNNVFAYFVAPENMVIEYTAEVEKIDETYKVGGPEDWVWPAGRIDQWGIAVGPTDRMKAAQRHLAFAPEFFRPAA